MALSALPLSSELVEFLQSAIAIQVATASRELKPWSTRGFGCVIESDRRTLCVAISDAQGRRCLRDLDSSTRVALNLSHVVDFRGIQIKGQLLEKREATDAERRAAADYHQRFIEQARQVGVPASAARGFWQSGPMHVLRVRAQELFEQTPGPGAGAKLETTWKRV